jgi:uncharacterized protein (TIGR02284 family)
MRGGGPRGRGFIMKRLADHDIKILNSLIGTTLDSADGYSQAAMSAADARHKELFQEWAKDRRQAVLELQSQLQVLGGIPYDQGALPGSGRMFLNLLDSITRGDESVMSEVERGEHLIKEMYEEALDDEVLSSDVRTAVVRAYGAVKSGHDRTRDLRHSLQRR